MGIVFIAIVRAHFNEFALCAKSPPTHTHTPLKRKYNLKKKKQQQRKQIMAAKQDGLILRIN